MNAAAAELELAERAARGDAGALGELLGRVAKRLLRVAWHMTYDHHEAQDLAQEALFHLSRPAVLRAFRGDGPLDGFLLSAGTRAVLSARRTRRFSEWRDVVVSADPQPRGFASNDPVERTLDARLHDAMARLPDRARAVVLLIAVGELSYAECAMALSAPVGTVRSTYSRARTLLARELGGPQGAS